MKISYGITVCTELDEIKRLINVITTYKRSEDEIVIIYDCVNGSDEVFKYLQSLTPGTTYNPLENYPIRWYSFDFNNNFLENKNFMNEMCEGDWIFQIDADEIPHQYLIENLPSIIEQNSDIDLMVVPRINTVEGITEQHIKQWGWTMNEKGWINFSDPQSRIYKNTPNIRWSGHKVHGMVSGYKTFAFLPEVEEFSLYHPKTIEKQEKQNQLYSNL